MRHMGLLLAACAAAPIGPSAPRQPGPASWWEEPHGVRWTAPYRRRWHRLDGRSLEPDLERLQAAEAKRARRAEKWRAEGRPEVTP